MAFERSRSGQANRALFFEADYTCYVEGDPEKPSGLDIAFWSAVFSALPGGPSVHFVARGGKPILEQLANQIVSEEIANTIVAMDRDYSEFREGRFIDDGRVFYTYGYSWENDVYHPVQLPRVAAQLARTAVLPNEMALTLDEDLTRLANDVGKFVFADFVAILKGGSVFHRSKPGKYTQKGMDGRPVFAKDRCKDDFRNARAALCSNEMRQGSYSIHQPLRFFWGKAYEHYVQFGLHKTVRECGTKPCPPEHVRDVAIACFSHCLATGQNSEVLDYYRATWQAFIDGGY